jgi:hypothetical protein
MEGKCGQDETKYVTDLEINVLQRKVSYTLVNRKWYKDILEELEITTLEETLDKNVNHVQQTE